MTRNVITPCAGRCGRVYAALVHDDPCVRTARIEPLERAKAWDGWVRVGGDEMCGWCFETKRRLQMGVPNRELTAATLRRAELMRIEVG